MAEAGEVVGVTAGVARGAGRAGGFSVRLRAAGLSLDRAVAHLAAGRVRVDGEVVANPDAAVSRGTRMVLRA